MYPRGAGLTARQRPTEIDGGDGDGGDAANPFARNLLLALVFALMGKALGNWLYHQPVMTLLAYTSVVFVTTSMLFGWAGLIAAVATHFAFILLRDGHVSLPALSSYAVAGALVWLVFRFVPRLSRGLADLRSLSWFVVATTVGAVTSTVVITTTSGGASSLLESILLWSRSTIVTLWVLAPPILILATRFGHRWLASIPHEAPLTRPVQVVVERAADAPDEGFRVANIRRREIDVLGTVGACLVMVLGITLVKLWLAESWGPSLVWWSLLHLGPVWWTARRLRLQGGLLAAGLAGFFTLASDSFLAPAGGLSSDQTIAVYAQLAFFWFVGTLLGWGAEREGRLVEELAASHDRLRLDLERVVRALTGALEAKDEYTEGHLHRVNSYALEVGRRLGLSEHELELLAIAGTLHDMGKIAIPEALLNKPGPLTDEEWAVMRRHPEIGARILGGIEGLQEAAPLVLHHHERWDGDLQGPHPGYPNGLRGEEIPIGARIISVVDTFDAMTTNRPYRKALPVDRARSVLLEEKGRQLDPQVVDVFLGLVEERPWMAATGSGSGLMDLQGSPVHET